MIGYDRSSECAECYIREERGYYMTEALHYHTIAELAPLIEAKAVSPVEVTEMILKRIEAVDGRLNAYATLMAEQAMAQARAAEREIVAGTYRGPLHGVPVAVKDSVFYDWRAHDGRQCRLRRPRAGFQRHSGAALP